MNNITHNIALTSEIKPEQQKDQRNRTSSGAINFNKLDVFHFNKQ